MLVAPSFEHSVLVTDDPALAARISALFARPRRYFPVIDGPRLSRSDADNEVTRRRNSMVLTRARQVLLGGLSPAAIATIRPGWPNCFTANDYQEHANFLHGSISRPRGVLQWGRTSLGIGAYQARIARCELELGLDESPQESFVLAGTHLLVACEGGDDLAEVIASNVAFASNASLAIFPELADEDREAWLEEIYALGDGQDVTHRFQHLVERARHHLHGIDFTRFRSVLFVTAGFPWGIAVPETPSTHVYRYPDFGRIAIQGIWASQGAERSARTALLIDPMKVDGSEIPTIKKALLDNGTLVKTLSGHAAKQIQVQFNIDLLPHDIIVISSHAGDAPGDRITYVFADADGKQRTLVADRALGISHDGSEDMFQVTEYHRFHSLDGVDWRSKEGKTALPVGSAIQTWSEMRGSDKSDAIVSREPLPRVVGSMAIQLHDGIWLFSSHGFSPDAAPLFVNNSCWSWHELSSRAMFAGARGYLGSLFPITDAEAQEVAQLIFGRYKGTELPRALCLAQQDVYGDSARRPYVLVGLPYIAIKPNVQDATLFLERSIRRAIREWDEKERASPHEEVQVNARRYGKFLRDEQRMLQAKLNDILRSNRQARGA